MPAGDHPPETNPIAALTAALAAMKPNPPAITLKTPTFDWTSTDQYDEFKLFRESVDSWFKLQTIPAEPDDAGIRIEYVLNFLGTPGRRKYNQWTPDDADPADREAKRSSAKAFLDHLASSMDHTISQRCRIYQLEDVRIRAGESPDELVARLRTLADRCKFPTEEEKERNVQYRFVRALNDTDLVRKLLALDIKASTEKMLETCRTHIAIADNINAMGLTGSKSVNAINKQGRRRRPRQNPPRKPANDPPTPQHSCGNCTKPHPPGRGSCPAKDSICKGCGKTGHWQPRCRSTSTKTRPESTKPSHDRRRGGKKKTDAIDVGDDSDLQYDEVSVVAIDLHPPPESA